MKEMRQLTMVVAIAEDGAIGRGNGLPWPRLQSDMARFKALTMGHAVVMGRKTWQSLPEKFRPLPGRKNVVITRNPCVGVGEEGAVFVCSIHEALGAAYRDDPEPCLVGGAEVYRQLMPIVTTVHLTRVCARFPGADAFLELDPDFVTTDRVLVPASPATAGIALEFVTLRRQ